MAKVSYLLIPEEDNETYWKTLKPTSSLLFPRVSKNTRFLSRQKKLDLKNRSLFGWFAEYWKELNEEEKDDWRQAGAEIGLTNWQLFIHDTAARKAFSYSGLSIPDLLHQGRIGWIQIDNPDDEIKITQLHPKFYWVQKLVMGHKRFFKPVKVTEDFSLPLKIQLSYFSDLVSVSEDSFAKFYAEVWHSFQGVDIKTELSVDLNLQSGWNQAEATLNGVQGQLIHYDLYFHLKGLQGSLYFDNVKSEHNAQNWVRDSRCDEVAKVYPRTWFLIPKNWVGVIVPENSFYKSTFKEL